MRTHHNQYLSTQEAAEEIGVKTATIYKYVSEKKLTPVYEDNWQIDDTLLFRKEDVALLKEAHKKPGLSTGEVAELLDIHPTTVSKYIKRGLLPSFKQMYKGRELYFVSEEDLEAFMEKNTFQRKHEKKPFYTRDKSFYLYQTFEKETTGEKARIIELKNNEGIAITEDGHTFSLNQLSQEGFVPKYQIEDKKYITKRGYVKFTFSKPTQVVSPIYNIIEAFYREVGAKNIKMSVSDDFITVEVKPFLLQSFTSDHSNEIKFLQSNVEEGTITIRHNGILIDSDVEPLTVHMPKEMKEEIKKEAKAANQPIEEYVLSLLKLKRDNSKWEKNEGRFRTE